MKCLLSSAKIFEHYFKDSKKALDIVNQFFVGKCNEVIELYKNEKDYGLSLVYNRDLFFLRNKYKVMKNYIRLGYKSESRETFEKCKFLNKKAYGLIFIPEKEKKTDKVNLVYQKLYEMTLDFIIDFLRQNIDKIEIEVLIKRETTNQDSGDKTGEAQDLLKSIPYADLLSDATKNELKVIYEMIGNNIRSRNVAPLIKKNEPLYNKLIDTVIRFYEKISLQCGLEVRKNLNFN